MTDYTNIVVRKPWGLENLIYSNDRIAIWQLHIEQGEKTSFHAHPNKKTGLILLSGRACVSFLSGFHLLSAGEKIMIRKGTFHSTEAVSKGGIDLLEVEIPKDKADICRLDDAYGRAGKGYEGPESYIHQEINQLKLNERRKLGDCWVKILNINNLDELFALQYPKIMVLSGGLKANIGEFYALGEGDIIDLDKIKLLAKKFMFEPMCILGVELDKMGLL